MNTVITSREAILCECRRLVMEKSISSINMRSVAAACGISVGSLYNYFPSKTDLISATVEDVWKDIFHMAGQPFAFQSFIECLRWLYESIERGCRKYPGFFTFHSVSFAANEKEQGRQMMDHYFLHLKGNLKRVLHADSRIRPDAFNEQLCEDDFIEIVFTTFTSLLLQKQAALEPLLEMTARCIY